MKIQRSYIKIGLLAAICTLLLTGCCDNEIYLYGRVVDASDGTPLDSVQVTFFQSSKRNLGLLNSQITDSTGEYGYDNFGCFKDANYFVGTFAKPGYRSQSVDFAVGYDEIEVRMERE